MSLYSIEDVRRLVEAAAQPETPFLILDGAAVRENARRFKAAFPDGQVCFAVKANNDPTVLQIFNEEGLHFDVASWGEIRQLAGYGISASRMVFSAPTKLPRDIARAYEFECRRFSFDTRIELEKLAKLAPGAQVIGRVAVDNNGSHWPLERKFGIEPGQEVEHMLYARELRLEPFGLTFHVGSQNKDPQAWVRALERLSPIWNELEGRGIPLQVIDAGGGYPTHFHEAVPGVEEIAAAIRSAFERLYGNKTKLWVEPGRGLVGNAGIMAATVINRATRGEREWLYLDVGAFQGLIEGLDFYGFQYPVISERNSEPLRPFVLSGPTCDSADVIHHQAMLPAGITLGDRVYVLTAGAYSNSMERYNGIEFPETVVVGLN
ncbi:MAG: type III PLP-dependent enzyme [Anaerolinea sp.]|nr:type III PLP-dependent enzyme [Anaerolinea sp.]